MQIPFRQGIVKATPNFLQLTGSTVSIVIAEPAYVLVTVADNLSNYLFAEKESVSNAWVGPFSAGTNYWLYWELHPATGAKLYGHTLAEPVESAVAPQSPVNDQHWYDSTSHKMKVWNAVANRWVEKIRVFAARLTHSSQFVSMSINSPSYEGTQVGSYVSVPVVAGFLVLDNEGKALRKGNGKFFTTEDVGITGVTNSSQVKFNSLVREAEAASNMAKHTIVAFVDFDTITPADPIMVSQGKLFGIIEEDVVIGDYVNVVFEGSVSSPEWDWTHLQMNTPLYIGEGGALVTTATAPALQPIAVVSGTHSIQFGVPKVVNTVVGGTTVEAMTPTVQGIGKLSVAAANPADPVVVGTNDPRMTDARLPLAHTHTIAEVTALQTTLDGLIVPMTDLAAGVARLSVAAANPADPIVVGDNDPRMTDNRLPLAHTHLISDVLNLQTTLDGKVSKAGDTMTGALTLSGDPTLALHAATKQYVDLAVGGGGGGGAVEPLYQVLYGTGTGVDSSPTFAYDAASGAFNLQPTAKEAPADMFIQAASASAGISANSAASLTLRAGDSDNDNGNGGTTYLSAGSSSVNGSGGNLLMGAGSSFAGIAGSVTIDAGGGRWGGDVYVNGGDCYEDFAMAGKIVLEGGSTTSYIPGPGGYTHIKGGNGNGAGAEIFTLGGTTYDTIGTIFTNAEQVIHVMQPGGLQYDGAFNPHANMVPCYRRFIITGSGSSGQFEIPLPVAMPDTSLWMFDASVLATTHDGSMHAAFTLNGMARSNEGTLSMSFLSPPSTLYQPTGTETWNISAFAAEHVAPTIVFVATPDSTNLTTFVITVNVTQYAISLGDTPVD